MQFMSVQYIFMCILKCRKKQTLLNLYTAVMHSIFILKGHIAKLPFNVDSVNSNRNVTLGKVGLIFQKTLNDI
jgi:hypothetical protein